MTEMKVALPVVEPIKPPGRSTINHMLRQKPPSKQPSPSVTSGKMRDNAPNTTPVIVAATKNAPWTASLTGGFMR